MATLNFVFVPLGTSLLYHTLWGLSRGNLKKFATFFKTRRVSVLAPISLSVLPLAPWVSVGGEWSVCSLSPSDIFIIPHLEWFVKSFFQVFQTFFTLGRWGVPLTWQYILYTITSQKSIVLGEKVFVNLYKVAVKNLCKIHLDKNSRPLIRGRAGTKTKEKRGFPLAYILTLSKAEYLPPIATAKVLTSALSAWVAQ